MTIPILPAQQRRPPRSRPSAAVNSWPRPCGPRRHSCGCQNPPLGSWSQGPCRRSAVCTKQTCQLLGNRGERMQYRHLKAGKVHAHRPAATATTATCPHAPSPRYVARWLVPEMQRYKARTGEQKHHLLIPNKRQYQYFSTVSVAPAWRQRAYLHCTYLPVRI